ncbi:MAG: hypothetical protein ACYDB0_08370 [Acidithiobacillus sp.]
MAHPNPFSIRAQPIITITAIAGGPDRAIEDPGVPSSRLHPRSVTGITATGKTSSAMPAAIIATRNGAISGQRNVRNRGIAGQSSGHLALFGDPRDMDLRSDQIVDNRAITIRIGTTVLRDKDRGRVETN